MGYFFRKKGKSKIQFIRPGKNSLICYTKNSLQKAYPNRSIFQDTKIYFFKVLRKQRKMVVQLKLEMLLTRIKYCKLNSM